MSAMFIDLLPELPRVQASSPMLSFSRVTTLYGQNFPGLSLHQCQTQAAIATFCAALHLNELLNNFTFCDIGPDMATVPALHTCKYKSAISPA